MIAFNMNTTTITTFRLLPWQMKINRISLTPKWPLAQLPDGGQEQHYYFIEASRILPPFGHFCFVFSAVVELTDNNNKPSFVSYSSPIHLGSNTRPNFQIEGE